MSAIESNPVCGICLASASPRRRALLEQIGVRHEVQPPEIDETRRPDELPRDYVVRMAVQKASSVWSKRNRLPVLGADTSVILGREIFGKPRDRAEAISMLSTLAGRTHEVLTAIALASRDGVATALSASRVRMRALSEAECGAYWDTGEPRDKAGAYAIQGLGAVFVAELQGSYSGVMGLPLYETAALLAAAGVPCALNLTPVHA
ncbi:MAG TPA: nucleoside triphosphate pyrophosphatase [Steroidobacteraceae bacterium]|nr:nucleoside triphosphate pyrophosphatase [Steroidobacteraceae bacterium]